MEGVARPDGVPLVGVLAPSPMGLRLEAWSTCGEKETDVGATRAVMVGTYMGTEATAGLGGVAGGDTRGGGGDIGGVWVMGVTTFIGLWGLGRTKGGGALTVGEEGRVELIFGVSAPADGNVGFVVGLEGREGGGVGLTTILVGDEAGSGKAAGEAAYFGEVEVVVMVETGILGALFWTGLSRGTVTEEVTGGSGGAGTVFTTATAGGAPPAVKTHIQSPVQDYTQLSAVIHTLTECNIPVESRLTGAEQLLYGPCPALLTQVTRNLNTPPCGRSVTL